MAFRKHLSGQKGFTLIELLVVVAILGILAGIAAPRVMDAINNARERKAEADLVVIRDALERFYLDYAVFPPSLAWLITEDYLDPNTTFTNAFGNTYFYAICLDDRHLFDDYRLGDSGRDPDAWDRLAEWDTDGTAVPEGKAPEVDTCDYWGDATGGHIPLEAAWPVTGTYTSVTDPNRSVLFTLAWADSTLMLDDEDAPVPAAPDTWEWAYQGQQ